MPSKDIEARRAQALDQPGLSPNQVAAINRNCDDQIAEEASRALAVNQKDREAIDAQIHGHETRFKEEFLPSVIERIKAGQAGRLGAKELVGVHEEITSAIKYAEGLINSFDQRYARIEEIRADLNAEMDRFYRKWEILAERRFQ